MRTLIISDLHLGTISNSDLLRVPELRAPLLDAVAEVDRVVLLGDVLELRQGPLRVAMDAARPFFEDLGRALAGGELVITSGNHDHALVEPWLRARGEQVEPPPLGLEQLIEPEHASPELARIAEWASPARVRIAYPGIWLRPDVYAMHGHYLDCHLTVPTLERLTMSVMSRLLRRPASAFDCVGDYEATGAPLFAWRDAVARDSPMGTAINGLATITAWDALRDRSDTDGSGAGANGSSRAHTARWVSSWRLRRAGPRRLLRLLGLRALVGAFPLAVAALNRAGLGPVSANISISELRRAGLSAMGEVAARLGLGDAYVVFGHTHRAGPLPGDDPEEWRGRLGARLVNAGSWTYATTFLSGAVGQSPYWPGGCVLVDDSGPPVFRCLLADRSHAEVNPRRAPSAAPVPRG
jgi:predicted phosphodiesterase